MKAQTKWIIIANLAILLGYLFYYLQAKERVLEEGQLVLLELAPVDPRSLMQGDYMRLDYAVSRGFDYDSLARKGYIVVTLDSLGVGRRDRFQTATTPLNEGEFLINYKRASWSLHIGAESFFFQEGMAEVYEEAKYGGLRIDTKGNSILVGLYNEDRNEIGK